MKTHTPGPWLARDYKNDDGDIWIDCNSWVNPKTASCRGGTLATAHASGTGQGSVEANARLIAAAPALLAAIERINLTVLSTLHGDAARLEAWLIVFTADVIAKATSPIAPR